MYNGSNCVRKSQLSEILTEPLNPRDWNSKEIVKPQLNLQNIFFTNVTFQHLFVSFL